MTAIRQRLLEVFEIEYQDHLEAIRKILGKADDGSADNAQVDLPEATRHAHSLKGAARAVGLEDVENLAHALESLFIKLQQDKSPLDRDLHRHVLDSLDEIEDRVAGSLSGNTAAGPLQAAAKAGSSEPEPPVPDSAGTEMSGAPGGAARTRPSSVRVEALNLDRLFKSAGELHADMLLQRSGSQNIGAITRQLAAVEANWQCLWKQLASALRQDERGRKTSRLLESGEQIGSQIGELSKRLRTAAQVQDNCARSLHHHLDDLEGRVKAARMLPAESVFGGFRKMVRDVANSEGKKVEVAIEGLDCEADRLVLQRIKDPVMHMLRNAVSHGIEDPDERVAQGKSPEGRIQFSVATRRDQLSIVVEDDGRGIDLKRIAEKAVRRGLLSQADGDNASEEALYKLLLEPGFTTADTVSKLSGRGVGLSVAREAVASLQGTLSIRATPGKGTRIEASLPVNILSRRLLLVSFRGQLYALPSDAVVKALRIKIKDVVSVEGRRAIQFDGVTLMLVSLGAVLQFEDSVVATCRETACVVVLRSGSGNVGVAVDEFIGVNDFVVRSLEIGGPQRPWSGVIATEDGAPCLVLNADAFSISDSIRRASNIVFKARQRRPDDSKVVLVVDDSITTRTLEKSILEAHGYKVRLSVDGRDAMAQLRSESIDIVVSDIEMPHVNGFDLVRSMKADKTLAEIPVVLVTSRDNPKDRQLGLELGADAYVVKQRFDQADLLRTIQQIV